LIFLYKQIKKDFFKTDWKDFLVYIVNQKNIYETKVHLQELIDGKFYKLLKAFIDHHRELNINIVVDMSNTETFDSTVSREFEKCIIDLISDERIRLKIFFPQKRRSCKNGKQLFEKLKHLTLGKETIIIIEDQYIEIHSDRRG
jgi:hypothetical protein